jgi:hypothetical protein
MVALAERLGLELDSSDRKNLVGSQIIPDNRTSPFRPDSIPPPTPYTGWVILFLCPENLNPPLSLSGNKLWSITRKPSISTEKPVPFGKLQKASSSR